MICLKKMAVGVALTAATLAATTSPVGAVTTGYWSFSNWHVSSSLGDTRYSETWTSSSAANEVRIKGYQDTGWTTIVADLEYAVVEDGFFGYKSNWVPKRITGNYTQNGTWYDHTFKGIPNGLDLAIRVKIFNGSTTNGAGNAYQS